jgi:hypothetical protein
MSAFVVDKNHIDYLVFAAEIWRVLPRDGSKLMSPRELGQMLWDENVRSVEHLYPSTEIQELPGHCGDAPYLYDVGSSVWITLNPVEVLKACSCYEYQSCEHEGWVTSGARSFIENLQSMAIRKLEGYEDAPWGAPEPSEKVRRLF